jgi:hypothetical protein
MEVGARPDGRLLNWSSLGQGLTPQVISTSYLVLGPVPYALARPTYHRVTKGQQGQGPLLWVHPGDQLAGRLKNGTFYIFGNATAQNIDMIVKTTAKRIEKDANRDTGIKMAG